MRPPNANTYKLALSKLIDRAWLEATNRADEHSYTSYDRSIAFRVALKERGLHITWQRGKRPAAEDIRANDQQRLRSDR